MSDAVNAAAAPLSPQDDNQLIAERREKLRALREAQAQGGGVAFPNNFKPAHKAADLHTAHGHVEASVLETHHVSVSVAGRMMLKRVMGKASFATVQDGSLGETGGRIQLYITRDAVGEELYAAFKHWDLGDIVGAEGTLMKTKTGELSIKVTALRLLTKSLRPMPDKFHGIHDQEVKYRQRYVDLMTDEAARKRFAARSKAVSGIREFMVHHGFLEVETPMLHPIPGGANARPFITHHNALEQEMFLRIAPELYLKRLLVGGFERVFEINRNFRNEGVSTRHNPEFTMLELYEAYATYTEIMDLTEGVIRDVAHEVLGTGQVTWDGQDIDLEPAFRRWRMDEAVRHHNPEISLADCTDREALVRHCERLKIHVKPSYGWGKLLLEIFEKTVEHTLVQPTFITDHPVEVSPLARANDKDPGYTDRFELFINGKELANGFSELNDPEDQAARFMAQVQAKEGGDDEAMHFDADYIRALEVGLPPTGGLGIGIDRLVMLLTGSDSIRDVLLFPYMRPEAQG